MITPPLGLPEAADLAAVRSQFLDFLAYELLHRRHVVLRLGLLALSGCSVGGRLEVRAAQLSRSVKRSSWALKCLPCKVQWERGVPRDCVQFVDLNPHYNASAIILS